MTALVLPTDLETGVIHYIPIADIEDDPNQPRQRFDIAELEELAQSIEITAAGHPRPWIVGLIQPITVALSPAWREGLDGPRWRQITGGRRLRAYRMRGWPEIPAIIKPAPESISRRLMTQMNENLARVDTTLWENAVAVNTALEAWKLEHRSGMVKDFARDFGRTTAWVSQLQWVANTDGLIRQALIENRIRHGETARLFSKLPLEEQRMLLLEARAESSVIHRSHVMNALRDVARNTTSRRGSVEPGATEPSESAAIGPGGDEPQGIAIESESPSPPLGTMLELSRGRVAIVFSLEQLRLLLARLEIPPPEDDNDLAPALYRAVADTMTQ